MGLQVISRRELETEALRTTSGISFKFVPEPSIDEIQRDVLVGLERFGNQVRSRAFQVEQRRKNKGLPPPPPDPNKITDSEDKGLGTNLHPTSGNVQDNNYLPVSDEVNAFLFDLQKELLDHLDKKRDNDTRRTNHTERKINQFLNKLKERDDTVAVPTDKTNSIVLMDTEKYIKLVHGHLMKDAKLSNNQRLQGILKDARALLEDCKSMLSVNEYNYARTTINKKAIPTIKLLSKDHKPDKKDENGNYPTRLVVPAKNFTAAFPHLGQKGIKTIMDRNQIIYNRKTIIQASHLKTELEGIGITKDGNTITSIDIEAMYPNVMFSHIEDAVEYFLRDSPEEDVKEARKCLELVRFGMANTLITFNGKYWEYGGDVDVCDKGLTIGGYESAHQGRAGRQFSRELI